MLSSRIKCSEDQLADGIDVKPYQRLHLKSKKGNSLSYAHKILNVKFKSIIYCHLTNHMPKD